MHNFAQTLPMIKFSALGLLFMYSFIVNETSRCFVFAAHDLHFCNTAPLNTNDTNCLKIQFVEVAEEEKISFLC